MRPLTDEETKTFFTKLQQYIGSNIKFLIERNDKNYVFRLIKDKVYYMTEQQMIIAQNFSRDNLFQYFGHQFLIFFLLLVLELALGNFPKQHNMQSIKFGQFFFKLCQLYNQKPSGEQSFLYGNNLIKAHVGRMTDNLPKYAGVVYFSMNDLPLGFGVSARSSMEMQKLEPTTVVGFNQSDIGEYLRIENNPVI